MNDKTMVDFRNPILLHEAGMTVLKKELGTVGAIYFLRHFSTGQGDYTAERDKLFEGISEEEMMNGIQEIENLHGHQNIDELVTCSHHLTSNDAERDAMQEGATMDELIKKVHEFEEKQKAAPM